MPLDEVAVTARGYHLFVEPNEVGGRRYWSDEIGGGVVVWDTSLVSEESLRGALAIERRIQRKEYKRMSSHVLVPVRSTFAMLCRWWRWVTKRRR